MRVAFAGTPPFAARALEALIEAGHDICLVLSQPDRRSGRGMKVSASSVSALALEKGLALHRPESLKTADSHEPIVAAAPDVMVVAAYGIILPVDVLTIPRYGCLNIHASLLPRWRGAAPVQRAILAGDRETGVGIMQMEAGLDTGPVLLEKRTPIEPTDTTGSLTERLADIGAEAIVEVLTDLAKWTPRPQDPAGVTYAAKISKAESGIDWARPAEEIARMIRAFSPSPGAETLLDGDSLKLWSARVIANSRGDPGLVARVDPESFDVACGSGALRIQEVQRAGSRRMPVVDFLRGVGPLAGKCLGR